jgi:hypothetical protein
MEIYAPERGRSKEKNEKRFGERTSTKTDGRRSTPYKEDSTKERKEHQEICPS